MSLRLAGISGQILGLSLLAANAASAAEAPAQKQTMGLDVGGTGGKSLPTAISADNGVEWRQADHVYIARGNVKAVRGSVTVYADTMTAHYRPVVKKPLPGKAEAPPQPKPAPVAKAPKPGQQPAGAESSEGPTEIYRLEAAGNVKFVTKTQTGYGDHADYDVDTTTLVMTGKHLKIVTPHDLLTARDTIEWYESRQLGVARGDAVDVHDGRTIRADVLVATMVHAQGEESQIQRVDAHGDVFVSSKDQIGRGDTGVYNTKTGVVTLTGHVRLTRGQNEMRGNYGVVDVNRNIGYLLPKAPNGEAGGPSGRVEALIVPINKDGKAHSAAPDPKKKPETGEKR